MASATDIITYIGIPLAVMGVVPLLWNGFRSILIRYRLLHSVPPSARHLFSLSADPVSGTVAVSIDFLSFNFEHLIRDVAQNKETMTSQLDRTIETRFLGRTWMRLNTPMLERRPKGNRFVVDGALRPEFVGVVCSWPTFVYLALALGVDPSTGGLGLLRQVPTGATLPRPHLTHADGTTLMSTSIHDENWVLILNDVPLTLSVRRSLAWELTMVVHYERTVQFIPLFDDYKPIREYIPGFVGYHLTNNAQCEISLCKDPLRAMLSWILYVETVSRDPQCPERLPVPQYFFKIREEVLNELRTLHTEQRSLEGTLESIFDHNHAVVTRILRALEAAWLESRLVTRIEQKRNREPASTPLSYFDLWPHLANTAINPIVSTNPTFDILLLCFDPLPQRRNNTHYADLANIGTQVSVLARLIIAMSQVPRWQQSDEWRTWLENDVLTAQAPMNPLLEIFSNKMPIPERIVLG